MVPPHKLAVQHKWDVTYTTRYRMSDTNKRSMNICCCSWHHHHVSQSVRLTSLHGLPTSMPGFPDLHYLPEFAQTHVCWGGDAIHLVLCGSPSPSVFNLSQHQGLFQFFTSGGQSIGVSASVLPMNIQGWFPLELASLISLLSKGLSRKFLLRLQYLNFY